MVCHCLVVVMGSVSLLGRGVGWCQMCHCLAVMMGGVSLHGGDDGWCVIAW